MISKPAIPVASVADTLIGSDIRSNNISIRFERVQEKLPSDWITLSEQRNPQDHFIVKEEDGICFLRASRDQSGVLQFGLAHPAGVAGLCAFEVKMKCRSNKQVGVLFGFRPFTAPESQQEFSATGLKDFTTDWQEITATMRGDLGTDQCFFFSIGGPTQVDLASLSIRQIPIAEYTPPTVKPTPREAAFRDIFEGWKKDILAVTPKPPILFLGDSITDNWDNKGIGLDSWNEQIAPLGAANWSIGSNRIEHVLWQVENSPLGESYQPRLIVLLAGINNLFRIDSTPDIIEGITNLLHVLRSRTPESRILLLGIYPVREKPTDPFRAKIEEINRHYKALADARQIFYLDIGDALLEPDGTMSSTIAGDFTHPTLEGYRRLARRLVPALVGLLVE